MRLFLGFHSKITRNCRGTAITEFAIAIPLLALLMTGTFEVGRAFSQYMALTQIAYEGARAGSQLSLSSSHEGCFSKFVQDDMEMSANAANGPDNPHRQIMSRVTHLIGLQGHNVTIGCDTSRANNLCGEQSRTYFSSRPTISAEYVPVAGFSNNGCADVPSHNSTYAVRIEGMYQGLLIPLKFKLSVQSRALVLSSNQKFAPELNGGGTQPEQKECSTEEIKHGKCPYSVNDCTEKQLKMGTCPYGSCTSEQIAKGICTGKSSEKVKNVETEYSEKLIDDGSFEAELKK